MTRLLLAVLLSGAASLAYQVSWTRRLADVTSATATAQAIVLAVFFAGLGLGAVYPGRLALRARRPLVGYALVELGALATALLTIPAFSAFDRARSALAHAGASPGAALAVELGLAGALLLVGSTLMGASLPFALEAAERATHAEARRRFVSLAYGVNTLGAAAGCALAGFVLIERIGLARTTAAGAALSLTAALVALSSERTELAAPPEAIPAVVARPIGRTLLGSAALAGAIGVGAEVVWTRLFSLVVLNTVYAFTEVLIAVLLGIVTGAILARRIALRASRSSDERAMIFRAAALAQIGGALTIALVPVLCLFVAGRAEVEVALATGRSPLAVLALTAALVAPVAFNAATLPLLVDAAATEARLSSSFGRLYAANTAGGVIGSLLAGFVLVPLLGTSGASAVLEGASLVLAFILLGMVSERRRDALAALVPGAAVVALHVLFPQVARQIYEARIPRDVRILELREGAVSDVLVTESDKGQRRIWINSCWVAGTGGGHKSLGHLPALFVDAPRRAVGIALGTGQTFAAVFANGVRSLDVVEINPDVVRLSRRWFASANDGLFERPGVRVHVEDGRAFLRAADGPFDLVVLEPLQAWSAGTSSLYSREFYGEARRVLARGGVVAQWIPLYGQGVDETRSMVRTALAVFPAASLWLDEHDGILLLHDGPPRLPPAVLAARIAERKLGPDLARKAIVSPVDLFALLVLGPEGLARWTRGAGVITDDRPFLEFAAARQIGKSAFRDIVRSLDAARRGGVAEAASIVGDPAAPVAEADAASRALTADSGADPADYPFRAAALEHGLAGAPSAQILRRRYRDVMSRWASGATTASADEALKAILVRAVTHDSTYGEGFVNLGILAMRHRDVGLARKWLERAQAIEGVRWQAQRLLAALEP